MARYRLLLPAMLVAVLATRCALPTATNVDLLQELRERRADVDGYSRACLGRGWGPDSTYASLTRREASRKADELVARHTARLAAWEACHREMGPKVEAYRAAVERARTHLRSAPHVGPDDADRVGQLLDESVQSATALVRDAHPAILELERAYLEHFRGLQASPSRAKKRLVFPGHIEDRERQVLQAMHEQVASAASYLEAFHRLTPSPETRARMNAARIMAAIHRGLDHARAEDERSDAERFRDFREELQAARQIAQGEIDDPVYAKFRPQTVARYRTMLGQLGQAERALGKLVAFSAQGPGATKAGRSDRILARFQAQTKKRLAGVQAIVSRVQGLARSIDAEP